MLSIKISPVTEDDYYEFYNIFNRQKYQRETFVKRLGAVSLQELNLTKVIKEMIL